MYRICCFLMLICAAQRSFTMRVSDPSEREDDYTWKTRDMMTGSTVLHVAAEHSTSSLVKLLRQPFVKTLMDLVDNRGATPLIVAVEHGNLEATRQLLRNGANASCHLLDSGQTVLHIASTLLNVDILEEILANNSSPYFLNWYDKNSDTGLLTSVRFGSKCAISLLKAGARHLVKNKKTGRNILHLSLLHQRRSLLKYLVAAYPENKFITELDVNGYSPLKLAFELKDIQSLLVLLTSAAGKHLVADMPDALIAAIKLSKEELFDAVLELSDPNATSLYVNEEGETAFSAAVTSGRVEFVEKLISKGVKIDSRRGSIKNILDLIDISNDVKITKILVDAYLKDNYEKTAAVRDSIICKLPLETFIVLRKTSLFNKVDTESDSPLYSAAASRNYGVLMLLLLSAFVAENLTSFTSLSQYEIDQKYLRGEIYSSDVYVLTGRFSDDCSIKRCPEQSHLFKPTEDNRNIFHACAIGGNLNTVIFAFKYCQVFRPADCQLLDEPDESGASPLHLAISNKNEEVALYFIQNGANLTGNVSYNIFTAIAKYIPNEDVFLRRMMSQCVIEEDNPWKGRQTLTLHMDIFCPASAMYVTDVGFQLCKLDYIKYRDVLCHPLFDYFVWFLWQEVGPTMKTRFYINFVSTVVFSLYVTVKYSQIPTTKATLFEVILWWMSMWLAKMSLCFHLPVFYVRGRIVRRLMLISNIAVPSLEMIYLVFFNGSDRTSLEVGGSAILASWLTLLFHGVATPNSGVEILTIAMIFQEMCYAAPTFFIVAFAFTLYLFTLFSQFLMYNNPLHAFLFTAFHIHQGSVVVPSFLYDKQNGVDTSDNFTDSADTGVSEPLVFKTELRTMIVEGVTVMFFMLVATAVSNMLAAVAIRAGKDHMAASQSKTIVRRLSRIREWEMFAKGQFYDFLHKCKALWIVGVQPGIKSSFVVPRVLRPLEDDSNGFDLHKMRNFVTKRKDLVCNKKVPHLLEVLEDTLVTNSDNTL